LNNLRRCQNCV